MIHGLPPRIKIIFAIWTLCMMCTGCIPFFRSAASSSGKPAMPEKEQIASFGSGWYEVYGHASMHNITPEQAREKAVGNACRLAVETHSGVEIKAQTFSVNSTDVQEAGLNTFLSLSRQLSNGRILEKKLLQSYMDNDHEEMVVKLRVKVGRQRGRPDPGFKLTAKLNQDNYHENDLMHLTVTSTRPCYLSVFNIVNDAVYVLFPNQYREDNLLKPGSTFHLPDQREIQAGISFPLYLSQGRTREAGIVKIIATKEDLQLVKGGELSQYGTYETGLKKLLNSLMMISRDQVEEADLPYVISK